MTMPIYLDYMATTPIDPKVVDAMLQYMGPTSCYGNPASSTHVYGKMAAMAVAKAREDIAHVIGASAEDIVFTSGATEADNLAILGAARFYQNKGKHVITMVTEHKAVIDSFKQLEKEGFDVTWLTPEASGLLDLTQLEKALRDDTILVSIMHVNNEIGTIQNIGAIGEILADRGIVFHVDAAQSAGKLAIDVNKMKVGLMSLCAHKFYGPKGIGALYVQHHPRIRLQAMSFGGGHEGGMRSGTLATHQIVGMAEALKLAESMRESEHQRLTLMRDQIWQAIQTLPRVSINGDLQQRIPSNLNILFAGIDNASLTLALRELAVSTTSACSSSSQQPSYVLKAIGLDDEAAYSSIRLSIGRFTTQSDADRICQIICQQIQKLQAMAPS
ncbi:IscS subfamily cysteine desulfurase [Legionella sp. W05-934-2]|jgi:cysteine desulfurase|uniref:IscS subfamily cysteine desulfurase n=1 Tax=Legionella sp. W05-934-2 TaxID=1198649 RepID=UPI0034626720